MSSKGGRGAASGAGKETQRSGAGRRERLRTYSRASRGKFRGYRESSGGEEDSGSERREAHVEWVMGGSLSLPLENE